MQGTLSTRVSLPRVTIHVYTQYIYIPYSQAGALQFVLCELLMSSLLLYTVPLQSLLSLLVFADYTEYIDCMDTIVSTCPYTESSCFSWNKDLPDWIILLFVGCYLELDSSGTIICDIDTNPYPAQLWSD